MIDNKNITNYHRSLNELQEFFIFCWFSKAANSDDLCRKINLFFDHINDVWEDMEFDECNLFDKIRYLLLSDLLRETLEEFKLGKYNTFLKAACDFLSIDLKHSSLEQIEMIFGMGPKTSRMFILHSRPEQRLICLDTHLLKFAREKNLTEIKTTPTDLRKYIEVEKNIINYLESNKEEEIDYSKFDLNTWKKYQNVYNSTRRTSIY